MKNKNKEGRSGILTCMYICFMMPTLLFYYSCTQNQTNKPHDNVSKGHHTESQMKESVNSNVPLSMVRNVKQARNGDILIASYLAVFRYDGTSFTNLTSKISSPRFSSFWDVLEDRKGNLWFASKDSGVYCLENNSIQHYTTKEGLPNNRVLSMYEDKSGNIWFATGGGLSCFNGKAFKNFTMKDGLPHNDITTIMEDKSGKIWIGTRGDACYYDGKDFIVFKNKDGKPFNNVWSIIEDSKGNIWLGGSIIKSKKGSTLFIEEGLWRYGNNIFTKVSERSTSAILEDRNGNIWTTGNVSYLDGKRWTLSRYEANSIANKTPIVTEIFKLDGTGMLCRILEANDGSIWFGALSGVYRYDGMTISDFKKEVQKQ